MSERAGAMWDGTLGDGGFMMMECDMDGSKQARRGIMGRR